MAINVSTLPEYVNQHTDELLTKAALGATTLDYVSIMPNVKFKDALTYLSSTVEFQDASICGWDPAGDDVLSQRTIEVHPIKINKEYCWKNLRKTALNHELLFAAGRETLPFEEKFIESNLEAIKKELEKEVWQNGASDVFPGFIYDVTAGDASVGPKDSSLAAGYDGADVVDGIYALMPTEVLEKGAVIFVSHTTFRDYVKALNATCCANRPIIDAASKEIQYPGDSRVKIVPISGLEGAKTPANKDFLGLGTWAKNLVYGTDVEGSENTFKMIYDEKEDKHLFKVLFNAGTAVIFPDEVAYMISK